MIKLKDLLVESDNTISSLHWRNITRYLRHKYPSINRLEYDKNYRGEFIRVVFYDYGEALNFYNKGWDILSLLNVDVQRTHSGGPKRWLDGTMFVVSYKIVVD
jgi:hypothetical protein